MSYIQKIIIKGLNSNIWKVTDMCCLVLNDEFMKLILDFPDLLLSIMQALQVQSISAVNEYIIIIY